MATLEFLDRKLRSAEAEERREATLDLGRSGRKAIPLLLRAIGDTDWRVRKTAVEALVEFGGDDVISGLIKALGAHDNAGERNSAIEALIHVGARAVDALLGILDAPDGDVRKFAVDILGNIQDSRAVPFLISKLDDPDENIGVAAAEALGKIRDPRAVDALLDCLSRYDQSWLDYAAAEALGEIGDDRALQPLIAALGRSSLREPVLESLGKIGNVSTLTPLVKGLADSLRIVREVSVIALAAIYRKSGEDDRDKIRHAVREGISERALEFLEELIITSGSDLQKTAIAVLGWAGREGSLQKLLSLLKEEDLEDTVVQALKHIDGGGLPVLLTSLSDENALVRKAVAKVLGDTGTHEAEEALIRLLADENGHVRSAAAEALGALQSRKSVSSLLGLLSDEYESVQESAIHALAAIGDESVLDNLVKDYTSWNVSLRRNIALLLGRFTSARAADALAFALKDEEPDVRKAVVRSLGNLPGAKTVRALLHAITDDDPEVRMLAADVLGKTNDREAPDALIPLLEDEDLWVRAAAARGLGRIGGEQAGEMLVQHLEEATDIFLLALVEVLGKRREEKARAPLLRLTKHEDPEVRKTVLSSLSAYGGPEVQKAVLSSLSDKHWSVRKVAVDMVTYANDPEAAPYLEKMVEGDPDPSVRQAAREALRR